MNQVAGAGIGHMNTENQEEEEEAQQRDTGHSFGLTHPDTKYNQTFAKIISSKFDQKIFFAKIYLQNFVFRPKKLTRGDQDERLMYLFEDLVLVVVTGGYTECR